MITNNLAKMHTSVLIFVLLAISFSERVISDDSVQDLFADIKERLSADNSTEAASDLCSEYPPSALSLCKTMTQCFQGTAGESALCQVLVVPREGSSGNGEVTTETPRVKPSSASVWGYGLLCVTGISLMSICGVMVLPFMSKGFYNSMLTGLIGLAVGSLFGKYSSLNLILCRF